MKRLFLLLTMTFVIVGYAKAMNVPDSTVTFGNNDVFVLLTFISMTSPGLGMVLTRDSLQKLSPMIDMDKELSLLKGERFQELRQILEGKRVWLIDRNAMTKETITLLETSARFIMLGGCFYHIKLTS